MTLRYRVCPDCGDMHDRDDWPDNHRRPNEALCAPMIGTDEMPAVQNQHDGQFYTSKRALRASYLPSGNKEGVRLIEIGDDKSRLLPRKKAKPDRKGIKTSIEKAVARFDRGERTRDELKFK